MAGKSSKRRSGRGELKAVLGKRRWSTAESRLVLGAQRQSGMSLAAYARRHSLTESRLEACRRRLDQAAAQPGPSLIPVRLVNDVRQIGTGAAIEIVVRGDRRLRVHAGFDATLLAQVIEVLESVVC